MVQWLRTSDFKVIGVNATFMGLTHTEVEILIWIMSPLWSKKDKCHCNRLKYHNSAQKTSIIQNPYTECTAASGVIICTT